MEFVNCLLLFGIGCSLAASAYVLIATYKDIKELNEFIERICTVMEQED